MSTMLELLRPFSFMRVKTSHPASRCLTNGEDVKSGELPQLVSSVPHLDLRSHVLPFFCDFSSFLPKFQKDGIIYERSFLNIMAEGGGEKEQKQVSPLNRPLPDLPGAKWLGCPLHKVSMTLNKMIGFVNGITVHGWL